MKVFSLTRHWDCVATCEGLRLRLGLCCEYSNGMQIANIYKCKQIYTNIHKYIYANCKCIQAKWFWSSPTQSPLTLDHQLLQCFKLFFSALGLEVPNTKKPKSWCFGLFLSPKKWPRSFESKIWDLSDACRFYVGTFWFVGTQNFFGGNNMKNILKKRRHHHKA